jgi:hypothetical protein
MDASWTGQRSFFDHAIISWNKLSEETNNSTNINSFKRSARKELWARLYSFHLLLFRSSYFPGGRGWLKWFPYLKSETVMYDGVTSHSNQNCARSVQLSVAIKFSVDRRRKKKLKEVKINILIFSKDTTFLT